MMSTIRRTLPGLMLLLAVPAWAGTESRIGTGGATELRIGTGARNLALGGAVLADASGVDAMFYNPAGLAATDAKTELAFTHTSWLAGTDINYFAGSHGFGDWGALGMSAKVLSVGDIVRTTEDAPDGFGETFSPTLATLGLTYSRRMTDRVNFGGTVYYIAERVLQETATGASFDLGFQYFTGFGGSAIGIALKNIGPNLQFSGSDFDFATSYPSDDPTAKPRTVTNTSALFNQPTFFQFGASYPFLGQGLSQATAYAVYQNNSFSRDEYRGGLEWRYRGEFALRGGYVGTGNADDLFSFSYGAGLRLPFGASKLYVDYAGQMVSDFFDDVQNISLRFAF